MATPTLIEIMTTLQRFTTEELCSIVCKSSAELAWPDFATGQHLDQKSNLGTNA